MSNWTDDTSADARVTSLRELPREIAPPRDLWPDIEARLSSAAEASEAPVQRTSRPGRMRFAALAAVVAALAVGMWIGRSLLPVGGTAVEAPPTQTANTNAPEAFGTTYVSDPRYVEQRTALLRSLEERLNALPPESREKVVESLKTIRQSMADIEEALGRDPSNALLQQLLVSTYQDEMRILVAVQEASAAGGEI